MHVTLSELVKAVSEQYAVSVRHTPTSTRKLKQFQGVDKGEYAVSQDDLVFYVKLYVKPERVDEWKAAVTTVIEAMSQEEAFVSCYLHQDAHDPNLFTLYERWSEPSVEAFMKNQMKSYRVDYDTKLETLLQRPREPQILTPLGQWHKQDTQS